jgi:hypothetical protein
VAIALLLACPPAFAAEAQPVLLAPTIGPGGRVVVPYAGRLPTYQLGQVPGHPFRLYLDFPDARAAGGTPRSGGLRDALFQGWRLGVPRPRTLRLALDLAHVVPVQVEVRRELHQLWLVPRGAAPLAVRPTPPPMAPVPAPATRIGRVHYDAGRQALVLPFDGATPGYYVDGAPARAVLVELPRTALAIPGSHDQAFAANPFVSRWTARSEAGPAVHLTFDLPAPGIIVAAVDQARRELLLFPQPAGELRGAGAGPRSILDLVGFDAQADALALPYYGQAPAPVLERITERTWYLTMPEAALKPLVAQYGTVPGHPLLLSWLLARLPEANTCRLAVTLAYPGHLELHDDPAGKRLLIAPRLGPGVP